MMNIVNSGCHALSSRLDVQEFMTMPVGASSFKECLRWCAEVFHALASILKERGLSTSVGDEGGFAPALKSDEEAIETILEAVKKAGYEPSKDFKIAMDAASSEWKSEKGKGYYKLPKAGTEYTSEELIEHWAKLCDKYPIISIEDGLDEEDWEGWQKLTARLWHTKQDTPQFLHIVPVKQLIPRSLTLQSHSILARSRPVRRAVPRELPNTISFSASKKNLAQVQCILA